MIRLGFPISRNQIVRGYENTMSSGAAKLPDVERKDAALDVPYHLEAQIGFILRRVHQRATAIFARHFRRANLSPVQFSALVKVRDLGRVSQNHLGRMISMDPATVMGVVNRLEDRSLIRRQADPDDRRRTLLAITSDGLRLIEECEGLGHDVTEETLLPLSADEKVVLLDLLSRIS
jgi:MarR family transcriptional regulator, lower aerobic nicotinate degradation pathway regulator